MNEIKLEWQGPVNFSEIINREYTLKFQDIINGGIYIHCFKIPNKNKYAITYVGKHEYSILNRNIEHYNITKKGIYALYSLNEESFFNIIYDLNDLKNFKNYINDVENNIYEAKIFYSQSNAQELYDKQLYEFASLSPLEGAIQLHLFKNSNTRKYFITKVSNYSLRNTKIINDKSNLKIEYEILGLDDEIITYQD